MVKIKDSRLPRTYFLKFSHIYGIYYARLGCPTLDDKEGNQGGWHLATEKQIKISHLSPLNNEVFPSSTPVLAED